MMTVEEINKRKEIIENISDPVVRVKELKKLCTDVELENLELQVEILDRNIAKTEKEFNALKKRQNYNRNQTVSQPQSSSLAFLPFMVVFGSILLLAVLMLGSL